MRIPFEPANHATTADLYHRPRIEERKLFTRFNFAIVMNIETVGTHEGKKPFPCRSINHGYFR